MLTFKALEDAISEGHKKILNIKAQQEELAESLRYAAAKQDGLEEALQIMRSTAPDISDPDDMDIDGTDKRRMRLGAKKRVVYELVAIGFDSIEMITNLTQESDVDGRYVRNVVRQALSLGDMAGDIEEIFYLTPAGEEILANAPLPENWDRYSTLISNEAPDAHASSASKIIGESNISPRSNLSLVTA